MTICPTGAIVEPIPSTPGAASPISPFELEGAIPEEFRPLIGNRIYGCDDCQLICRGTVSHSSPDEEDFSPRKALHAPPLVELFAWSEAWFLKVTEGRRFVALATCAGCAISPSRWAMRPGMKPIFAPGEPPGRAPASRRTH